MGKLDGRVAIITGAGSGQGRAAALSISSDTSAYLEAPFGGVKRSGIGREQGMEGLSEFTEIKNVFISDR